MSTLAPAHLGPSARARFDAYLERRRVRKRTWQAIRRGQLVRQPCEVCGSTAVHAHHDDYSKPFDVRWLCGRHHQDLHNDRKAAGGAA